MANEAGVRRDARFNPLERLAEHFRSFTQYVQGLSVRDVRYGEDPSRTLVSAQRIEVAYERDADGGMVDLALTPSEARIRVWGLEHDPARDEAPLVCDTYRVDLRRGYRLGGRDYRDAEAFATELLVRMEELAATF